MRAFHQHISLSPMTAAAGVSLACLVLVIAWKNIDVTHTEGASAVVASTTPADATLQQELALLGFIGDHDPNATSTEDALGMIGPVVMAQLVGSYAGLLGEGTYSSAAAEQIATEISGNVRATVTYDPFTMADLRTDADTSYERMLQYRNDLRTSLAPLVTNTEAEFAIYARYKETADPAHLEELRSIAGQYRAAAAATAEMVVPRDAVNYHLGILNAMQYFAAVIDSLASHADDPMASVALLRSYNDAEAKMFTSFNSLSAYYGQKTP